MPTPDLSDVTAAQILDELNAVVEERGRDFVYSKVHTASIGCIEYTDSCTGCQCVYVVDNEPSCIAACVFARLGVPMEYLCTHEGVMATIIAMDLGMQTRVANILRQAQIAQDYGWPWGAAYQRAVGYAEALYAR